VRKLRKWIGISSAILTSAVLGLSLTGLVAPGCGGGDSCQDACQNILKCNGGVTGSSSSGFGLDGCTQSCRDGASSKSASSLDEYHAMVDCLADAPSCTAVLDCVQGASSSSSGSGSSY
jgi:hypothetical protein